VADRVRIGVIGLGIMGEQYVRIYQAHPSARVTAISTRRADRLAEIGDRHGVEGRCCDSIEMSTANQFTYPKTFLLSEVFGRVRGAFAECLSDFLTAITQDTEPRVTAFDGRQVTAVLDAISRSLASGRPEGVAPGDVPRA
jgi:predicted dehydrogenase